MESKSMEENWKYSSIYYRFLNPNTLVYSLEKFSLLQTEDQIKGKCNYKIKVNENQ